jgi:hypothetical protein
VTLDMAAPDPVDVQALAREVAALLRSDAAMSGKLLTARQVAARFNVDRGWVYAHAQELGALRLGNGPRPRLRFDPAVVAQRLVATPRVAEAPPAASSTARASLLPITPSRPRPRSLET